MAAYNQRTVNGIATVVISGRDYVTVAERIRVLHELKKEFDVLESEPRQYGDRWVWRVVVRIDGHQYIGSAEVHTNAKAGSADATDCWAVAETSAIGRAIAFAGLGTVEGICSYEEVTRTQPQITVVESSAPQITIVEQAPAPQIPSPQPNPQQKPTIKATLSDKKQRCVTIWHEGKTKLGWKAKEDMAAYVSFALDRTVTEEMLTDLDDADYIKIAKHLANEAQPNVATEEVAA